MPAPKHSLPEQEQIILDAAASCIEETTLLDFTMAGIGKHACYSMGSIYKHVQSKEDVLVALASKMFERERSTFHEILSLDLTGPEKIMAVFLRDPSKKQTYSFDLHLDAFVSCDAIQARASHLWKDKMIRASHQIEEEFKSCFRHAIGSGELKAPNRVTTIDLVEELNMACWAFCIGMNQVLLHQFSMTDGVLGKHSSDALALDHHLVSAVAKLLNAYDWQQKLDKKGIKRAAKALAEAGLR